MENKSINLMERMGEFKNLHPFNGLVLLNEANLNHIMSNAENNGIIIISANRDSIKSDIENYNLVNDYISWLNNNEFEDNSFNSQLFLVQRNKEKYKELYNLIKSSPYSYSQVYGGFKGSDDVIATYEPSFIIYCVNRNGEQLDFKELFEFGKTLCKKFNQESFFSQAPNDTPNYYDCNGVKQNETSSNFVKFNRDEMFFTTAKKKKNNPQKFTSDIVFENKHKQFIFEHYTKLSGIEYTQKIKRTQAGEFLLT